jgi:hypothetical protein
LFDIATNKIIISRDVIVDEKVGIFECDSDINFVENWFEVENKPRCKENNCKMKGRHHVLVGMVHMKVKILNFFRTGRRWG